MLKKFKQQMKNEKGLTLVELLAVIVILGIISAIAVPAIGNIITNSKVNALKADGQNALAAANIYFTDTGATTVSLTQLKAGYLDDEGGFKGDATFKVDKIDGGNQLTGVAKNGTTVSVKFIKATNAEITAAGTDAIATGSVQITR
ncbi:type II secretion system protein [Sporosarcina sp. YIM B06819]|uniref:type II secretion system protein n=1 Tax=Sporosarcina sp. YIM B06819 TaxID=3081769 RepID=UPI00298C1972|nr:prepilin-type N-terminal cleavage/methylation domain-containing protein [Sporosarcina sp. YIM B06819]